MKAIVVNDSGTDVEHELDDDRVAAIDAALRPIAPQIGIIASGRRTARDALEALSFLVGQLAYTEQQVYEKKYTPMQYEELLPLDFAPNEGQTSIRYEMIDQVGQGRDVSGAGDDTPMVDVGYSDKSFPIVLGSIGYQFTNEEMRQSAFLRRPLDVARLRVAMEAYRRTINQVALFGNSAKNLTGLYNNALVTAATRPSAQSWANSTAAATPDKIIADLTFGLTTAWNASANTSVPTHIAVAPLAFAELLKPRSTNSDTSILNWFLQNNLAKQQRGIELKILPGYGLDTAGGSSATRAVFYAKDDDNLTMKIPMPLKFGAPQFIGIGVKVFGEYKYSGVEIRRPTTAYYMDAI